MLKTPEIQPRDLSSDLDRRDPGLWLDMAAFLIVYKQLGNSRSGAGMRVIETLKRRSRQL
jgi:hypothetical protein